MNPMKNTDQAEHDQRNGNVVNQLVGGMGMAFAIVGQKLVDSAGRRGQ